MKTNNVQSLESNHRVMKKAFFQIMTATALLLLLFFAVSCGSDDDDEVITTELTISSITPNSGGEGTIVQINGTGFSATASANEVTLSGKSCTVTSATTTQLKITIPATAATGNIIVKVAGKTAQSSTFTFTAALSISSISPTSGPKGTEVTVNGVGFSATANENMVSINDKTVSVKNATTTRLTITIPAGAGSGPIQLVVGGNSVQSTSFTYMLTTAVTSLAGSTSGFADGTGIDAQFSQPYNTATDAAGNIYVTDAGNHKIRKITPAGVVTTLAGSTQGDAEGTGEEAQFNYPYGIATDADGNVYVADTYNHKIKKITQAGVVTTLAGSVGGYTDATGTEAQFNYPTGITTDASGNVYVADKDNHKIRKITSAGVVTTLAGSTSGYADGTGTAAQFNSPYDLTVDANGNVYVADASNHRIRKVTAAGEATTLAGSTQGDAEGTGTAAQFYYPFGITMDKDGNVLVADTYNHKIKKITSAGVVTTLAGTTGGYADGDATTAQFNYLTGIDADADGNIFAADKDNHKIRMVKID